MNRSRLTIILFLYTGHVLIGTFYPFQFFGNSSQLLGQVFARSFKLSSLTDFVNNVVLFLPFGFLLCCRRIIDREKTSSVLTSTAFAGAFSLAIELTQAISSRNSSAFDVLANTLGASVGALLAAQLPTQMVGRFLSLVRKFMIMGVFVPIAVLLAALPIVLSIAQSTAPSAIWNPHFDFQIGNEGTLNRPWFGKIHFVGLYNRALTAEQVKSNYDLGHVQLSQQKPLPPSLVSLYAFREGQGNIVRDISEVKPPLDLSIGDQVAVRWLEGSEGIEILQPAILRGREPITKLIEGFRATDELSVEAWITPRDNLQSGPARIISFSRDTRARNFTLGQQGGLIEFRLRTPASGLNGSPLALQSTESIPEFKKSHVVATYKNGLEIIYINGFPQSEVLDLKSDGIIGFGTRKTQVARAAYSFFYFFPVSFLVAAFLSSMVNPFLSRLVPLIIGAGLSLVAEVFQVLAFTRETDHSVILWSMFMAALGTFSGLAFALPERGINVLRTRGSFA